MTAYGAKILHLVTLLPAMRKNIPVFTGSSRDTVAEGTLVHNTIDNPPRCRAFAVHHKQTLLRLRSLETQPSCSFLARSFTILVRHAIMVDLVTTSENSIVLALDTTHATSGKGHMLTTTLLTASSSHYRVEAETGLASVIPVRN